MDEKDALIEAILSCNLSEGRRALIRLKKMAAEVKTNPKVSIGTSILYSEGFETEVTKDIKLSTKIEDAPKPASTTIGDKKVIKKAVTKPVKPQASG